MENVNSKVMPGDAVLVEEIVNQLKSQGIFDQWRKDCLADVDTKPAYQNLQQRVESTVTRFLEKQIWNEKLNKNQLRERLRKHILSGGFLDKGLDRITDQVVDPKVNRVFLPVIKDTVYSHLGLENPDKKVDKPQSLMNMNLLAPGSGQQPGLFHLPNFQDEKKEEPVSDTEMALDSGSSPSSSPTPPTYSPIAGGLASPRSESPMRISPDNITSSPSLPSPVNPPLPPAPTRESDSDASSMDISYSPDAHNEGGRRLGDIMQEGAPPPVVEESLASMPSPKAVVTSTSALSQISSDDSLPAEPSPRGPVTPEPQSDHVPPPPEPEGIPPPPPPAEFEADAPPPPEPLEEPPLPPPSELEYPPAPPPEVVSPPPPAPPSPPEDISPPPADIPPPPSPPEDVSPPPPSPPEDVSPPPPSPPEDISPDLTPSPQSGIQSPESAVQKGSSPSEDSDIEVRVMNVSASVKKMELQEVVTISPDSVSSVSLESSPSPPQSTTKPTLESMLSDISDSPDLKKSPSDEGEIESDREKRKKDNKKKGKGKESDSGEISDSSPEIHRGKKKERKPSTSSSTTSTSSESSSEDDRRRRPHDRDRDRGRDRDDYSRRSSYDRKDRSDYQRSYYSGSSGKDYYRGDVKGRQMVGEQKIEDDSPGSSKENVTPERNEKEEKKAVFGEVTQEKVVVSSTETPDVATPQKKESGKDNKDLRRSSRGSKETSRSSERRTDDRKRKEKNREESNQKKAESSDKKHGSRSEDKKRGSGDVKKDEKSREKSSRKDSSKDSRSQSSGKRDDKRSRSSSKVEKPEEAKELLSPVRKPKIADNFDEMRKVMKERRKLKEQEKEVKAKENEIVPENQSEKAKEQPDKEFREEVHKAEPGQQKDSLETPDIKEHEPLPTCPEAPSVEPPIPDRAKLIQLALRPPAGTKTIYDLLFGKSDEEALQLLHYDPPKTQEDSDSVLPALDLYEFEEYRVWGKKTFMTIRINDKTYSLRVSNVKRPIHPLDLMKVEQTKEELSGKRVRKANTRFLTEDFLNGPVSPARAKQPSNKSPIPETLRDPGVEQHKDKDSEAKTEQGEIKTEKSTKKKNSKTGSHVEAGNPPVSAFESQYEAFIAKKVDSRPSGGSDAKKEMQGLKRSLGKEPGPELSQTPPKPAVDQPLQQGKRVRKLSTKYGSDFLMVPRSYKEAGEERLRAAKVPDEDYSPVQKKRKGGNLTECILETGKACKRENSESSDSESTKEELTFDFPFVKPTVMIPKPRTATPPKLSPTSSTGPDSPKGLGPRGEMKAEAELHSPSVRRKDSPSNPPPQTASAKTRKSQASNIKESPRKVDLDSEPGEFTPPHESSPPESPRKVSKRQVATGLREDTPPDSDSEQKTAKRKLATEGKRKSGSSSAPKLDLDPPPAKKQKTVEDPKQRYSTSDLYKPRLSRRSTRSVTSEEDK